MPQEINLYTALTDAAPPIFSGKFLVQASFCVIGLLLFTLAIRGSRLVWQMHQSKQLQIQQLQIASEFDQFKLQQPQKNSLLEQNLALRQEIAKKTQLLYRLDNISSQNNKQGYSAYLQELAQSAMPELWLSRITLSDAGQKISLQGSALTPVAVSLFLQKLNSTPAFSNKKLQISQLLAAGQGGTTINFVLTHQPLQKK